MARRLMMLLAIASLGVLALAFAGCGGSDKSAATTETTAATTETTTEDTDTTATDTTATDTTATETTDTTATTDTTSTSGADSFADAENCQEFSEFGQKISSAFTGSGDTDLQKVADELNQMAAAAPSDIKPDFQTIADGYGQIADALQGVNLSSGQAPDAGTIAKLTRLSTQLGTNMSTAAQHIATWAQQNCT